MEDVLVGAVLWVLLEFIAYYVFYLSGYCLLKVVTFGKKPGRFLTSAQYGNKRAGHVMLTGLLAWAVVIVLLFLL